MTILEELLQAAEHLGRRKVCLEIAKDEVTQDEVNAYNEAKSNFIRVLDKHTEQLMYEAAAERSEMVENLSNRGEV